MRIGYVGLGNMGGALARRFQEFYSLQVYDLSPHSVHELVRAGATAAQDLPSLARDSDIVFLCLPTSDHVRRVIFGEGGLHRGMKPGMLIVDQSTGFPQATREMAAELAQLGVSLMDAPVSGGPSGATAGTIAIMVGADADAYQKVAPVLAKISSNVVHAGGVGNGHVAKIVNNMVSFTQRLVTYEAFTLGVKSGVSPAILANILARSTAQNGYMQRVLLPKVLKGNLDIGFSLGLTVKDMALASDLGMASGVPLALGNLAKCMYERFGEENGLEAEVETSVRIMEREAGTSFVPTIDETLNSNNSEW